MAQKKKITVIDLFSGCGGFSFGFQKAGYDVILGVDNVEIALKTFGKNHKHSKGLLLDLHNDDSIDQIIKATKNQPIDVIIAGPPCQGFSLTGTRNEKDKRNILFYSVFNLAKKIKPKAIIIENVPGLARLYNGKAKNEILRLADELGYNCTFEELFAPDYGVPQIRKRIFFVMVKKEFGKFVFPEKILSSKNYISCEEAIDDLPSLEDLNWKDEMEYISNPKSDYQKEMRENSTKVYNHIGTIHSDLVVGVISQVPEGGNHKDLPEGIGESRKFNEAWTRYHSKKPSKTIDTGHRNHFHYKWNRVPTVRENARLQSFPDDFIFLGNKTEQYKQVGNAVPPLLGEVIALELKKML